MDCLGFKSKCVKDKLAFENLIEKDQDLDRWTAPGKENTPYQAERGRVFFFGSHQGGTPECVNV